VVDFKPGGGTDTQARYFAANWGKFIPGNPRIKVTNLFPNPAGMNYMAKTKPDGLTLSFVASPNVGVELVNPQVDFENAKLTRIGSHAKRDMSLLVRGTVPYDSLREARGGKTPIIMASALTGVDDLDGKQLGIGMLAMWMEAPLRIIALPGGGTSKELLQLERGDTNAWIAGSQWYQLPKLRPGWLKDGYLKPIAYLGNPEVPASPNSEIEMPVPNAYTWLNEEQREIWEGIFLPEVLCGKNIVGPADMPAELTQVLRDAYADAVNDPEFAQGLEKIQGEPPSLIRGEDLQRMIVKSTAAFKKQLPRYEEIRQQVYDYTFK
jgi:tripartite-type tricarboxylate transporter receptor subunit TctC